MTGVYSPQELHSSHAQRILLRLVRSDRIIGWDNEPYVIIGCNANPLTGRFRTVLLRLVADGIVEPPKPLAEPRSPESRWRLTEHGAAL